MNEYQTVMDAPAADVARPQLREDPYAALVILVCFALVGLFLGGDK